MLPTADQEALRQRLSLLMSSGLPTPELEQLLVEVQRQLAAGELRVVEPRTVEPCSVEPRRVEPADATELDPAKHWQVLPWVKRALILAAQLSSPVAQPEPWSGTELHLAPWQRARQHGLAPFGCHVRASAFVAESAALMPSAVIQAGAHVGSHSLVDAHVLVGNCAYVGDRVVLQAGATVAGHLLPEQALPNIVEDGCQLGGGSGLYDGVVLGAGSILLPGTIVSAQTGVFDLAAERWLKPDSSGNLWLPSRVVIGMGSRPAGPAALGLQVAIPIIVGRRE